MDFFSFFKSMFILDHSNIQKLAIFGPPPEWALRHVGHMLGRISPCTFIELFIGFKFKFYKLFSIKRMVPSLFLTLAHLPAILKLSIIILMQSLMNLIWYDQKLRTSSK